jgi:hypothetical protein
MAEGAGNNNQKESDATLRVMPAAASETAAILIAEGTYLELNSALLETQAQLRSRLGSSALWPSSANKHCARPN